MLLRQVALAFLLTVLHGISAEKPPPSTTPSFLVRDFEALVSSNYTMYIYFSLLPPYFDCRSTDMVPSVPRLTRPVAVCALQSSQPREQTSRTASSEFTVPKSRERLALGPTPCRAASVRPRRRTGAALFGGCGSKRGGHFRATPRSGVRWSFGGKTSTWRPRVTGRWRGGIMGPENSGRSGRLSGRWGTGLLGERRGVQPPEIGTEEEQYRPASSLLLPYSF